MSRSQTAAGAISTNETAQPDEGSLRFLKVNGAHQATCLPAKSEENGGRRTPRARRKARRGWEGTNVPSGVRAARKIRSISWRRQPEPSGRRRELPPSMIDGPSARILRIVRE